jgi:subtilisin-like proprotein convertase family protein
LPDGSCAANLGQATCTCEGGIWRPGGGCNLANANHDCDSDGDSDWCDVPFIDCNNNGQPDTCEEDCNLNSTVDECDVASQDSPDCNDNVIPDECEIDENSTAPGGPYYCTSNCAVDCNNNGVPDECDVSGGASPDCNTNGVPDECEIDENSQAPGGPYFCTMDCADDCNDNGIPDECELDPDCSLNLGVDCNFDGQLDACDADCNSTATSDICELILSPANGLLDCSGVGGQVGSAFFGKLIHDANCAACHAEGGFGGIGPNHRGLSRFRFQQKTSGCVSHVGGPFDFSDQQYADLQAWLSELGGGGNGIPDECEGLADCDSDGIADACALTQRVNPSEDCDGNSIPDECDIASNLHEDCNGNGVPDLCEPQTDCNTNNQIDECDILQGISQDCSGNGIPDECEADCQPNGIADSCDIDAGTSQDCDGNGVPDECEPDCQPNGVADACDISSGASQDVNSNAIPDECEADCNGNGLPDDLDLEPSDNGTNHTVDHSGQPQGGLLIPECDGQSTAQLVDTAVVDFGPACSTIEVLRVGVQIEHTWLGDVVAEVESPQGTVVTLFSRPGLTELDPTCPGGECCGSGANTMDALFGDGFPTSVETTSGFVGSFHADAGATGNGSELAAFTGEPFCGTWALRVYDASEYDEGVLQAWSLNFLAEPLASDCNNNSVPDACEIDEGSTAPGGPYYCTSVCDPDCNNNGIPDNCEDCNGNGVADSCDLAAATSPDCNGNAIPDECEAYRDCNSNGIMDACDLDSDAAVDCDQNGAPDTCDIAGTAGFFVTGALSGNVAEFDPVSSSLYEDLVTNEEGGLFIPFDMAWTPTGNILVGSVIPSTIREFDGDSGAFLREVVTGTASQNGNLATPFDIEIHPDGSLLVMDFPSTVKRYDYTFGSYMGPFITLPNNESAYDMQYAPTGELLIANFTTGEILAYDGVTGTLVGPYTTGGTLLNPSAMAFNAAGELFVADSNLANDNIQRFDASGTFVEVYVPFLATGGQALLGKLAFGPDDQLYATHGSVGAVIRFHDDDPTMFDQFDTSTVAFPVGLLFRPASNDCNSNAVPDECEDCNGNALADSCDIAGGFSQDVDGNQIPDECEGADVSLGVTVRAAPGDSDSELSLPASDPTVPHGEPFVIELWATDRGPVNSGLLQIATELSFTPDIITALFIEHRPPFTDSTFGFIDNAAGTIGSLGGFNGAMDIVGIEPEWRRIAIVHSFASDCGMAQLGTSEDLPGIFRIGRGLISNVDYGSGAVEVVRDCTYDLDGSGFINAAEVGLFSPCWLTSHGEPGYDAACDFDCSGTVDAGDLGWFAGAWMQFCTDLTDDDVPPCQRCGQAEIPDGGEGDGEGIVLRRKRHTRRVVPRTDTTARIGWRWTGPRSIDAGSSLVLEILLRDDSVGARGLAAAFVDVGFDPAQVSVQNATIDTAMGLFAEQVVSQGTIRVGGSSMVGAGSSEWAPLARVTFVAQQALRQPPAIRVAPAHSGVSSVGAGTIAPQHIRVEPLP